MPKMMLHGGSHVQQGGTMNRTGTPAKAFTVAWIGIAEEQ